MRAKKYLVVADPHVLMENRMIAGVNIKTNNAIVKYMEDEGGWDGYINLGDTFDLNVISDHNKGKLKLVEGQRLMDDYRAGNALLTQHFTAMGGPSKFYLLEGNHEFRVKRYIDAKPELDGFINLDLHIPEFVTYVKSWSEHELLTVGKANFIHGIGTSSGQCAAALRDYGATTFMGHAHSRSLVSMRYHGPDSTKIAESMPCLCNYQQPYLNKRPTSWQNGFAVFYFWPNGKFNYFVVSSFEDSFIAPNGKFYNGKKDKPDTRLVIS